MSEYEKLIIDLNELPDYKFIQFLRVEILNVRGYGPTFFARVRYAYNGCVQQEGLPMDLSKGIFIGTLRDEQLGKVPREELEKTLQKASIEITKIVRKDPNLRKLHPHYNQLDYNEECVVKDSDDVSVSILKSILKDYTYLKYDEKSSEPPNLLRCSVNKANSQRQVQDIFEIADKLSTATGVDYKLGSYGGSSSEGDNLDEVWTRFSLRNFNFEMKCNEN